MAECQDGSVRAFFERRYADVHAIAERNLRREHANHTLRPTELVHLAFEMLSRQNNLRDAPDARMLGAAAVTIRRELVNHARKKGRLKHGGGVVHIPLDTALVLRVPPDIDWLTVEEAFDQIEAKRPAARHLAELCGFSGCTVGEAAALLGMSPAKASEALAFARAWLLKHIERGR